MIDYLTRVVRNPQIVIAFISDVVRDGETLMSKNEERFCIKIFLGLAIFLVFAMLSPVAMSDSIPLNKCWDGKWVSTAGLQTYYFTQTGFLHFSPPDYSLIKLLYDTNP